jgi:hypothetical protein
MSDKELKELKKALADQKKKVVGSQKEAQKMLHSLGIVTPKGKLTQKFKSAS